MTEPLRMISQPWVTIAQLPASRPTLDDDTWDDLILQASEMLYLWSGRQFPGEATSTVALETFPDADAPCRRRWEDPWASHARGIGEVRDAVVARLPDPPVTSIERVQLGEDYLVAEYDYRAELPAGLLWRTEHRAWPTDQQVLVTYTHGVPPPIGGQRAAILLAVELGRSWAGQKCNLPRRIETITREGLTINMAGALPGWRTGLWDIDGWLNSVNPHMMTKRASAWSPDAPRARRMV